MDKKYKKIIAQILFILAFATCWQIIYGMGIKSELVFPSIPGIGTALVKAFTERNIVGMVAHSIRLLIIGLIIGIVLAMIFSSLSVVNDYFFAIYNMIVSMFDLIPGIALTPILIAWVGIGDTSIIVLVVHSVIWPMSRSVIDGFNAVPNLYLEVGQNIGLNHFKLVTGVFLPAALPRIFSGIKTGWARAWRGLISAEMIFGGGGALGIGYFITDRRTNMDVAGVFAAIIVIIIIGSIVEYGIFKNIEDNTFKKWGMSR